MPPPRRLHNPCSRIARTRRSPASPTTARRSRCPRTPPTSATPTNGPIRAPDSPHLGFTHIRAARDRFTQAAPQAGYTAGRSTRPRQPRAQRGERGAQYADQAAAEVVKLACASPDGGAGCFKFNSCWRWSIKRCGQFLLKIPCAARCWRFGAGADRAVIARAVGHRTGTAGGGAKNRLQKAVKIRPDRNRENKNTAGQKFGYTALRREQFLFPRFPLIDVHGAI